MHLSAGLAVLVLALSDALWYLGNTVFTLFIGLITVYGVMLVRQALGLFRRYLQHQKIGYTTIAEAPDHGLIKLNAKVAKGTEYVAPLSGVSCAFWKVTVWLFVEPSKPQQVVLRRIQGDPLALQDATGQARVELQEAELELRLDVDTSSLAPTREGLALRQLLVSEGIATAEQAQERNFTARERHLCAGEDVHVLAPASRVEGELRLGPDGKGQQVLITDRPGKTLSERFFGRAILKLAFGAILVVGTVGGIVALWGGFRG